MMKNTTIIIFGATGDLAKRKLIPALYRCVEKNELDNAIIIGAAFDDVTSDAMIDAALPFVANVNKDQWNILKEHSFYTAINFTEKNDFKKLHSFVQECEKKHGIEQGNRLFYLAVGAQFFCLITENITALGLAQQKNFTNQWHRIVYEKPFGHDLVSAREINACIAHTLDESQIYRIDHYLTKEIVSNIAMIRFTNAVFEPLWSNRYIDQMQIILSEAEGI